MSNILDTACQFYWKFNAKRILAERPKEYRGDNTKFTRFILLAHQRTGSSMVMATLNKHPSIVAFGELFVKSRIGHMVSGFNNHSKALHYLRSKDPVRFLEEHAYSSFPENISSVGFKIFPDQLERKDAAPLLPWLNENKDVKIIILTRNNLLDVHCSLAIANKTGVFGIRKESDRQMVTINVDIHKAEAEFKRRKAGHQRAREKFVDHEVIELAYEDIIEQPTEEFKKIQSFIGVTLTQLHVPTVKQETRPLSEVIENYDELKIKWKGAEYEEYL